MRNRPRARYRPPKIPRKGNPKRYSQKWVSVNALFLRTILFLTQAGAAALAAAASKPGAVQTESGLVIESVVDGDGDFPTVADTVRFNFVARLPDGTEIDSTFRRGTPVEVPVASAPTKGLAEGLQVGTTRAICPTGSMKHVQRTWPLLTLV